MNEDPIIRRAEECLQDLSEVRGGPEMEDVPYEGLRFSIAEAGELEARLAGAGGKHQDELLDLPAGAATSRLGPAAAHRSRRPDGDARWRPPVRQWRSPGAATVTIENR
ncbi:MAG: hypothetical protein IT376_07685 [Polyangiaceae bacterium]|nr:hypothetical protein [Polyangiaceae bacterium]